MTNVNRVVFNPELYKSIEEKVVKLISESFDPIFDEMVIHWEDCEENEYVGNPYNYCNILKLNGEFGNYNHNSANELEKPPRELSELEEMMFGKPDVNIKKSRAYIDVNGNESDGYYTWVPQNGDDGLPDFVENGYSIFINKDVDEKVAYKFFQTYYARLCLYVGKNQSNDNGIHNCYEVTPYVDFTKEWTDAELFKLAKFTDEEIAEVYRVIPKFY